jgi:hypothetical protein
MCHPNRDTPTTMNEIVLQVIQPFVNVYHHIFTDKLYTSLKTAKDLLALGVYMTGAVKSTSKDLPTDFLSTQKNPDYQKILDLAKAPRGSFYARQNGQYTSVLWKDTKGLQLLSSAQQPVRNRQDDFLIRRCNVEGERRKLPLKITAPPHAINYTQNMGGVDRADQLRSYYTCARKSQHWWKQLVYFLVDASRVNAYICFKHLRDAHKAQQPRPHDTDSDSSEDESDRIEADVQFESSSHFDFTLDLATQLIDGFAEGAPKKQQRATSIDPVSARNAPQLHRNEQISKNPKGCIWCKKLGRKTKGGNNKMTNR